MRHSHAYFSGIFYSRSFGMRERDGFLNGLGLVRAMNENGGGERLKST
jgi:hypothetical protein